MHTGCVPSALDDLGLSEALDLLVRDVQSRSSIEAELRISGTKGRLSPESRLTLFRIAQEALRNVERHSGASRVQVFLQLTPGASRLTVVDNGHGFHVAPPADSSGRQQGLGLIGMRERAPDRRRHVCDRV